MSTVQVEESLHVHVGMAYLELFSSIITVHNLLPDTDLSHCIEEAFSAH